MTTISYSQPLPFDLESLADWLATVGDLMSAVRIETLSSERVVVVAGPDTPFANYKLVLLPQAAFGITFSAPYLSGAIGEVRVLDPGGQTLVSVTDLPAGGDIDALLDGSWLAGFGAEYRGSEGADTLQAADGANILSGAGGADSITGGAGFDAINGNMGDDTASGAGGDDWVVGGRDNDVLDGGSGADIVYGNLGNDWCDGGEGADIVRGGQGADVVFGQAGDDWLSSDRGDDTLTGGAGADIFHSFAEAGIDRVTDFSAADGDRVQLDPGTAYTLAQVGADTVVDMGGGNQVVLVGVQLSTLPDGWIIGG